MSLPEELGSVEIYTDGSCLDNPGPGGWGAVLKYGQHELELSGGASDTTNNRMELMAVIEALKALKRTMNVVLYTDSKYVQQGITEWIHNWKRNGWKNANRKPVKNVDLWKELEAISQKHEVTWKWVRGHVGNVGNERVDVIANAAANRQAELEACQQTESEKENQ